LNKCREKLMTGSFAKVTTQRWFTRFAVVCSLVLVACSPLSAEMPKDAPAQAVSQALEAVRAGLDVSAFLPAGATLVASAEGDLDADGDNDVLMVYAPAPNKEDAPRTLRVLLRDSKGVLLTAATNPNAILCRRCGGMMGDPLQPIRIGSGGFTLRFEGGSRELWFTEFRFEVAKAGGWRLAKVEDVAVDRMDGARARKLRTPKDFGEVALEAFDVADFPAGALP
jgi:hypothetical protein